MAKAQVDRWIHTSRDKASCSGLNSASTTTSPAQLPCQVCPVYSLHVVTQTSQRKGEKNHLQDCGLSECHTFDPSPTAIK